jgi:CRP/FNR family cyclic AMP-dependent transcriptional regulator
MHAALLEDSWFCTLMPQDADRLVRCARARTLARGQTLYWKGDDLPANGASFFALLEGTLKASALAPDGRETILRVLDPGNWFGELSVIDGLQRDYSMTALSEVRLLEVGRDSFLDLMQEASFANAIARLMGMRLRMFYATFEHATSSPPLTKVAHRLVLLAHRGRIGSAQKPVTTIKASQDEMCAMLGLSRPTLIRAVKALEACGAITQKYGEIEILDLAQLQHTAESGGL